MRIIDADVVVTALVYDDEHEEWFIRHMTIADYLDAYTDEGCPPIVEAAPVRKGKWINIHWINGSHYKRCNQCFAKIEDSFFGESSLEVNFCPKCGADMRGESSEQRPYKQTGGDRCDMQSRM